MVQRLLEEAVDEKAVGDFAEELDVSSWVVQHQIENNNIAMIASEPRTAP